MAFELPTTYDYGKENPEDWKIYEDLISKCPMKEPALSVLKWSGLSDNLIKTMEIGFIENVAIVFTDLSMKYGMNRLKEAGLIFRKGTHEGKYLFTFHKILIPFISDNHIKFIRGMKVERSSSWIFQDTLKNLNYIYNEDLLKKLKPDDTLHIMESILDCLNYMEKGENAIGILGIGSFKDEYFKLLGSFNLILHRDSTNPDSEYSRELASMFVNRGIKASRGEMPSTF